MIFLIKWIYRTFLLALFVSIVHSCEASHLYFDESGNSSGPYPRPAKQPSRQP
jgi:hypothetical protein